MRASVNAAMSSAVSCARCDRSAGGGGWAEASVEPAIASMVVPATSAFHMGISMNFVAARSERRTDRAHKLSFGHAGATIHKAAQPCTTAGTRALVRNSLNRDQARIHVGLVAFLEHAAAVRAFDVGRAPGFGRRCLSGG